MFDNLKTQLLQFTDQQKVAEMWYSVISVISAYGLVG